MAKQKARYFTFLVYPDGEGLPSDWIERLELIGLPIAISPLHDKDKSSLGGYKKAHYHCIYVAKNPVTADSVRVRVKAALSKDFECKAVSLVQVVAVSMESMYLYLTHESKDAIAKGKHVYPKSEVKHLSGFDIDRYVTLDAEEKEDLFNLLCDVISTEKLANILELKAFLLEHGAALGITMATANSVLKSSTGLVRLYFDAVYQERRYGPYKEIKKFEESLEKERE